MYRLHSCDDCKYDWIAKVVLSEFTTNLSGEKSEYCSKCGKRSDMATPAQRVEDIVTHQTKKWMEENPNGDYIGYWLELYTQVIKEFQPVEV